MDHVLHHGLLVHRARRPGQAEPPGCVGLHGYNGELPLGRAPAAPKAPMPARREVNSDYALLSDSRSEEHTSELQSLMRISYAVLCLKKKQQRTHDTQDN